MSRSDQSSSTLFTRIGTWFRRANARLEGDPQVLDPAEIRDNDSGPQPTAVETRSTFLRPWAKRDQAITSLQEGVGALSSMMNSIRDNLEANGRRQEELLKYLSHLPEALATIPESNRVQGETLKAIHQQLSHNTGQQQKLGDILERLSSAASDQKSTLDVLEDRMEQLNQHDARISENLSSVGQAMTAVSRHSADSTKVLEQLRENLHARDSELQAILNKQGSRFTTMLAVAIILAIAALAAVGTIAYLGYHALQKTGQA
jgi:DNA repair exonuclease SbcCD ATPase subunit